MECSRALNASLTPRIIFDHMHAERVKRTDRVELVNQRVHNDQILVTVLRSVPQASRERPDGTNPNDWYTDTERVFCSGTATQMRCMPRPAGSGASPYVITRA